MMLMKTVTMPLANRSYPIYIGEGLLNNNELLTRHLIAQQLLIVSTKNIAALYLKPLQQALSSIPQCDLVLLPDGESYKDLATLTKIFDQLLEKKHLRNTTLIALGGGVICDMTGFAAACYQRGVAFIQIPTTLLAQVDASIGGKTAVNHPLGKNMIGAFHQPRCVLIDVNTLSSLSDREYRSGIAEIVKAALICDAEFFDWLERNTAAMLIKDKPTLLYAITRACEIKATIVSADEAETTGMRALLNLGHTFGHAIEQISGYGTWLHGEAVAMGLVLAAELSQQLGKLAATEVQRIKRVLGAFALPIQLPPGLQCDKMLEVMAIDKKNVNKGLRLVLLAELGKAELSSAASIEQVRELLMSNLKNTER